MKLTKLWVTGLMTLGSACGAEPGFWVEPGADASAIIGGRPTGLNDFPAVGALLLLADDPYWGEIGSAICTGTLVDTDVVVLAAHCLDVASIGLDPSAEVSFYFSFSNDVSTFGVSNLQLPAKTTEIADYVVHPDFTIDAFETYVDGPGDYKDIAVAFLAEEVTDRSPAVVMEPDDTSLLVVDAAVQIVGYGVRTANYDPYGGSPGDSGIKYDADSVINEVGDYEMQIGDYAPVPQKCHGDSGGPTFLDVLDTKQPVQRLIGVTSHAYDDTDCARGGVDTRVDVWRDWIETQLTEACSDGVRVHCLGGGVLPLPTAPTPPPTTGGGGSGFSYTPAEDDGGCAALPASPWALFGLVLLGLGRRRLRR